MYHPVRRLASLVSERAREAPGSIAVRCSNCIWTYEDLVGVSSNIAAGMVQRGVSRGDRIAIILPREADTIGVMLAAAMIGAAYVPIDPDYPDRYISDLVTQSRPTLIVAANRNFGFGEAVTVNQLTTNDRPAEGRNASVDRFEYRGFGQHDIDDIAYCIFTSGSTGTPKCAEVWTSSVLNLLTSVDTRIPVAGDIRGAWWTSPAFDVSAWEVWSVLTRGGTLSITPPEMRLDGAAYANWLRGVAISSAYVPPTLLSDLRDQAFDHPHGWSLQRLLVGVEPIRLGLLQEIMSVLPGLRIVNGYGPAEATVCCTLYDVPRSGGSPDERCPIGTMVQGSQSLIVSPDGLPAEHGELYVSGACLARGYLNDQKLTAAKFVQRADGQGRAYRTGDLVRKDSDGNLIFLGRIDRQLKVRGYRVEAGAVESVLVTHPKVRECVIDQRDLPPWGAVLVAYVVPELGRATEASALIRFAAERLPAHAVPSLVVTIDNIPQTLNGKIDRLALAALPLPDRAAFSKLQILQDTTAAIRDRVLVCMASVLPSGSAAADASFTEQGGTSIAAVLAGGLLRSELNRQVSAADVLGARSLTELAEIVSAAEQATAITRYTGSMTGPLLPQQLGIWFAEQIDEGGGDYLEHLWFEIDGPLDLKKLQAAVTFALQMHPIFGAIIQPDADGLPVQILGQHVVEPTVVDMCGQSPDAICRFVARFVAKPFSLEQGPIMRCMLLRQSNIRHALVIAAHHLVIDGWTARLLARHIGAVYNTGELPVRQSRVTVCDIARSVANRVRRDLANGDRADEAELLVRADEAAALMSDMPIELPDQADVALFTGLSTATEDSDGNARAAIIYVSSTTATAIGAAAENANTSRAAVWLAAFARALETVLQAANTSTGLATSGRDHPDTLDLAGCFANTVLLRLPSSRGGARARVNAAAASILEALHFADVPFTLVAEARLRDLQRRPTSFPAIYFSYDEGATLDLAGLTTTQQRILRQRARFDVSLTIEEDGVGVYGVLECRLPPLATAQMDGLRQAIEDEIVALTASIAASG